MQEFCNLGFMEKAENIVFLGNSGVGKTHLATAIGVEAARHHNITYFIKCHDLLQQLKKAKLENRLEHRLKHFNHYKLLIIDEIGYLPIDKEDSNLFFQLIDMRYEKKSTIFTPISILVSGTEYSMMQSLLMQSLTGSCITHMW